MLWREAEVPAKNQKPLGSDAEFWDARQCVLDRNADDQWVLSPVAETTNETLLNGKAVTKPVLLRLPSVERQRALLRCLCPCAGVEDDAELPPGR
jgi:hypothetical protein